MQKLVKRCMSSLSLITNTATGLAHPLDDARAKELFLALKQEGADLSAGAIHALALDNGWSERHAKTLAELADRIGKGGRVVIEHPRDWGEEIVARHKAEINGNTN